MNKSADSRDEDGAEAGRESSSSYDRPTVNEHTRLLPNRLDSDAPPYLSPDDPAVSPYNLFTVRLIRYITIFLALITFLWWILVLITLFITPPGLHSPGSSFFAFAYATVALATLVTALLFFAAPSSLVRALASVTALLLFVQMIIIVSVERTRHEEAWLGIVTVIWALLMAIWAVVTDRTVQWGKRQEEERLTGRPESRRTVFELVQVTLESVLLLVLSLVSILLTCTLILRALDAGLSPPGNRYWVDGEKYQIHVYCHGNKSKQPLPTVLIEGGEDTVEYGLWQFADNAINNGSINRYCFADRPGLGWSDTAPSPLSVGQATEALSEALARAGETGPWVLLSAGIGSTYSRVFSSRHGADIHGLLMIDPLHEDLLKDVGAPGRGFWLWLRGVISPLGLDRTPGALFKGRNKADRVWGRSAYQSGKTISAKLQESLVANSLSKRDVVASRAIQYQDVAVTIVSSGVQMRKDAEWEGKQRDLGRITHNLKHWDIVDKAPHQVWRTLEGRETIEKRLKSLVHARREPGRGIADEKAQAEVGSD